MTDPKREALLSAERALLGGLLLDPGKLAIVAQHVEPADLTADPRHKLILEAIFEQRASGWRIDEVSIESLLRDTGRAPEGLMLYLAELVESTPSAAGVETYARAVSRRAGVRRLYTTARDALRRLEEGDEDTEVMAQLEATVAAVRKREPTHFSDGHDTASEIVRRAIARENGNDQGETHVSTGLTDLDAALGGMGPGLYVIGGRSRMGKSAIATTIGDSIAWRGRRVAVFSSEMTEDEWIRRSIAQRARVRHRQLRLGGLDGGEWARVMTVKQDFPRKRLMLDDGPLNPTQIVARAQREHERDPLAIVIVDYLQRVAPAGDRAENREQKVASAARAFKDLSKKLHAPVLVLAQLNAGGAKSDPAARTTEYDFRESNAIFFESDVCMAIKRPIVWDRDADPREAKIEIIKFREGEEADVRLDFEGWCTRFCDHDPTKAKSVSVDAAQPPKGWQDDE